MVSTRRDFLKTLGLLPAVLVLPHQPVLAESDEVPVVPEVDSVPVCWFKIKWHCSRYRNLRVTDMYGDHVGTKTFGSIYSSTDMPYGTTGAGLIEIIRREWRHGEMAETPFGFSDIDLDIMRHYDAPRPTLDTIVEPSWEWICFSSRTAILTQDR